MSEGRFSADHARARQQTHQREAERLGNLLVGTQVQHGTRVQDESLLYGRGGLPTLRIMQGGVCAEHFSMSFAQARLLATLFASDGWRYAAQQERSAS